MTDNGEASGPTPKWWRICIFARPLEPGVDGLNEVLVPVIDALAGLDRLDERGIIVKPDALGDP